MKNKHIITLSGWAVAQAFSLSITVSKDAIIGERYYL
jgi:hypothetical protein